MVGLVKLGDKNWSWIWRI